MQWLMVWRLIHYKWIRTEQLIFLCSVQFFQTCKFQADEMFCAISLVTYYVNFFINQWDSVKNPARLKFMLIENKL